MSIQTIERDFKKKVCDRLRLVSEGIDRYRVFTPFMFEDGDHLAIVLKKEHDHWMLSDEGHTYMHLTYDLDEKDLQRGSRQKIITNALSAFDVKDRDGELVLLIQENHYGNALYNFVQALLKITDVTYPLTRTGTLYLFGRFPRLHGRAYSGKSTSLRLARFATRFRRSLCS